MSSYNFTKFFRYFPNFVKFVFRNFPSAYASLAITVIGVAMEYAALSVMIPLSNGSNGNATSMRVTELWHAIVNKVGLPDGARTWLWLFLLLLGIRMIIGLVQILLNTYVAKRMHAYLSSTTFCRVVSDVSLSEIYKRSVGHYIALAGDESVRVGQLFFFMAQTVSALLAACIGLWVLYLFSPLVFKFTMLFLIVCAAALSFSMRRVFSLSAESGRLSREASTIFIEALNGLRSIRSMAGESYVRERYSSSIRRYAKVLFMVDLFNHSSRTLPGLILLGASLVILFPGAVFMGDVSVVYFFTITTMLIRVLSFLGVAVASGGHMIVDIRAAFELDEILGRDEERVPKHRGQPVTSVRNITFSNLGCGYSAKHKLLSGISIEARAGRSYGVIGRSGSGKSTLADVFLGLLLPQEGELHIDGVPYKDLDATTLRRHVVLVEQHTRVFSGTLRENIAFGLPVSDQEIEFAIELAGLQDFMKGIPAGLDTHLDYQGANLSGGQRQRVGLARALVRQPDVLILDEATSALDGHTRDAVMERLRDSFRDRILVMITHDERIWRMADEVWCIDGGTLSILAKDDTQ
ncbi:MAG: transporter family protein [Herminiimonas sp.]|nr:transporter family protein [Herminiimonas sp.]